jgi:DNA-binding XRE family transcriptional regulator
MTELTFGVQLARTRRRLNVTQRMLADTLGVAKFTIIRIERGYNPPSKATRQLLEMWIIRNSEGLEL